MTVFAIILIGLSVSVALGLWLARQLRDDLDELHRWSGEDDVK